MIELPVPYNFVMFANTPQNLDALLLTVRDVESRRLTHDAVTAYQAGAFRAAILSIWAAACADIIGKIKELAIGGDAAAQADIVRLNDCIARKDLRGLQNFENDLLNSAEKKFGMLLPREATDIARLREDRNLCAHPAFVSDDALFSPTPELVRAHIVHAVIHLLAHPPIQGKQLIARLNRDLLGGSFPASLEDIVVVLRDNYLVRAKDASIVSLIKALATSLVGTSAGDYVGKELHIARALAAIGQIKPGIYEDTLPPLLLKLGRDLEDHNVVTLCRYAETEPRTWDWIGSGGRARICAKIQNAKLRELNPAMRGRHIAEIGRALLAKVKADHSDVLETVVSHAPCRAFVGEALSIYSKSGSYRSAETNGEKLLLPHAPYLHSDDIEELNRLLRENPRNQILNAGGTLEILVEVFQKTRGLLPEASAHWGKIAEYIVEKNPHDSERYETFFGLLQAEGISTPAFPPPAPDDDLS